MKILLVNAVSDEVRNFKIEMGGRHEIWSAGGLQTVPALVKSSKPDAVVLFISDLNPAYPLLIRSMQVKNDCLILALAPFTHMKLINQVLDWGVDSFLTYPCDISRVKGRLESLFERQADHMTHP